MRKRRMQTTNTILANDEIPNMQRLSFEEADDFAIHLGAVWLHRIEHERRRARHSLVHNPAGRIVPFPHRLNMNFALEHGVGVVEDGLHRVSALRLPTIPNGEVRAQTLRQLSGIGRFPVPCHLSRIERHARK